jgi:sphingomyelin phosphodiesterase
MCHQGNFQYFHAETYVNRLLKAKPAQLKANNYLNTIYDSIYNMKNRKTLTVVHMSDPHIDYQYRVGSDTQCTGYLCCRDENGYPTEREKQAGEWGAYMCDLPPKTLKSMFEYIKDTIKPDALLWTGDNSPHSIWDNTPEEVIDSTGNITTMMADVFRGTPITVFPLQGNHDVWPSNNQDFSKPYGSEYVLEYSKMWQATGWLDAEDAKVFDKYGYYSKTLKLKDGREYPKTKIIALNTNSCYYMNFAMLKTRYDPGDQLAWFEQELAALESIGGQAILIAHIPPIYYECVHGFAVRFQALVERYQHVVRFGLYGHEHDEWMQLYTSIHNPTQRIGHAFMSGSATTFTKKNPSFTVVELDEEFMVPVNLKIYYFNISQASLTPTQAKWELLHDYLEHYSLRDMSPDAIYTGLALKVRDDETVAKKYLWNKIKQCAVKRPSHCLEGCR